MKNRMGRYKFSQISPKKLASFINYYYLYSLYFIIIIIELTVLNMHGSNKKTFPIGIDKSILNEEEINKLLKITSEKSL